MFKKVNGVDIKLSAEEEVQMRAFWIENERIMQEENQKHNYAKALQEKYRDPYEAIDKLCRHLKIDFATLED